MADYDVVHGDLVVTPVGAEGEFYVGGTVEMDTNTSFYIKVRVTGISIDTLTATRIIGGALAEIAASVNHSSASFNINSTSVKAKFGTLT